MKRKDNKLLISIVVLLVICWLSYYLAEGVLWSYLAQKYLETIILIITIIIALLAINLLVVLITKIRKKRQEVKNIYGLIGTVLLLTLQMFFVVYTWDFYSTGGLFNIIDKGKIGDAYYIYVVQDTEIDHYIVKLRCNDEDYEQIIVDQNKSYLITYKWSKFAPDKGDLEKIEIKNH